MEGDFVFRYGTAVGVTAVLRNVCRNVHTLSLVEARDTAIGIWLLQMLVPPTLESIM